MNDETPHRAKLVALALFSFTFALTACTVGPDYTPPEISVLPAKFDEDNADNTAAARDWWRRYHDPELDRLVDKALLCSPTVAGAVARIEDADAKAREIGADALPSIEGNARAGRTRYSGNTGTTNYANGNGGTYNEFTAGLTANYELDFWGKWTRARESARADALASRYALEVVRITLAAQVAATYFEIRSIDSQIKVTEATRADQDASLEIVRARAKGGVVSELDIAQAESAIANSLVQRIDLRRKRRMALNKLGLLCADPGMTLPEGDLAALADAPAPPAGLPSELLRGRPDVRQAEEKLISANALIGNREAYRYPTFSLTLSNGIGSNTLSNILSQGSWTWALGAGISAPIFDMGKVDARVDQAKAGAAQALAEWQSTLMTAFQEVSDSLGEASERKKMAEAYEVRRNAARKVLGIARGRYEKGASPYLEVLEAQQQLNQAEREWLNNREQQLVAAISVFKALGGGWHDDENRPPLEQQSADAENSPDLLNNVPLTKTVPSVSLPDLGSDDDEDEE